AERRAAAPAPAPRPTSMRSSPPASTESSINGAVGAGGVGEAADDGVVATLPADEDGGFSDDDGPGWPDAAMESAMLAAGAASFEHHRPASRAKGAVDERESREPLP